MLKRQFRGDGECKGVTCERARLPSKKQRSKMNAPVARGGMLNLHSLFDDENGAWHSMYCIRRNRDKFRRKEWSVAQRSPLPPLTRPLPRWRREIGGSVATGHGPPSRLLCERTAGGGGECSSDVDTDCRSPRVFPQRRALRVAQLRPPKRSDGRRPGHTMSKLIGSWLPTAETQRHVSEQRHAAVNLRTPPPLLPWAARYAHIRLGEGRKTQPRC